jgi:hypothetical protein
MLQSRGLESVKRNRSETITTLAEPEPSKRVNPYETSNQKERLKDISTWMLSSQSGFLPEQKWYGEANRGITQEFIMAQIFIAPKNLSMGTFEGNLTRRFVLTGHSLLLKWR